VSDIKLHKTPRRWPLILISLDKLVKGAALIVIYFILAPRWRESLQTWLDGAQENPHNLLVRTALEGIKRTVGWSGKYPLVRIGVIVYAGLYLIEGIGLIFERKWAEWMVVIGTALFLPVEVYDFIVHPRPIMPVIFTINVAIAVYLIWRLHRQHVIRLEREALARKAAATAVENKPEANQITP
jgi:uncharacterized membrane protein (DUF2068 family)